MRIQSLIHGLSQNVIDVRQNVFCSLGGWLAHHRYVMSVDRSISTPVNYFVNVSKCLIEVGSHPYLQYCDMALALVPLQLCEAVDKFMKVRVRVRWLCVSSGCRKSEMPETVRRAVHHMLSTFEVRQVKCAVRFIAMRQVGDWKCVMYTGSQFGCECTCAIQATSKLNNMLVKNAVCGIEVTFWQNPSPQSVSSSDPSGTQAS